MARARLALPALVALTLAAAPAGAQAIGGPSFASATAAPALITAMPPASAASAGAATDAPLGPRLDAMRVAAHKAASTEPRTMMVADRAGLGQAKALMIVGGAAFIAGAIIGDAPGTIIMIGGAAVGLYGLYQYLQ